MAGIYKLTAPNGKCYIGQSVELNRRFSRYRAKMCKKQRHLYNAIKKYGWENFKVEVLWSTKRPERYRNFNMLLDTLEIAWIKKFDSVANGYNLQSGGHRGRPSEETKQLLREANLGKKQSQKTIRKRALAQRKPVDQYTLEGVFVKRWSSIKDATEGVPETTSGNISSSSDGLGWAKTSGGHQWRYASEKVPPSNIPGINHSLIKERPVVQYSLSGELIKSWDTIAEAARTLKLRRNSITRVCDRERKSTGGFQWRFKEQATPKLEKMRVVKGVMQLNEKGETIREWTNATEASRGTNTSRGNITSVCRGKRITAGGFKWKYT